MKKLISKIGLLTLSIGMLCGCTDSFDNMNTDPNNPTETSIALLFPKVAQYGYCCKSWEYQLGESLYTSQYAQYVACTTTSFTTDRYNYVDLYSKESFWRVYYNYVARTMSDIRTKILPDHPEYDNQYQVMRILAAFVAIRTTDIYGDMPYTEGGTGAVAPAYDSQKDIYYALFEDLDEAISTLEANKNLGLATFGSQDVIYNGDYDKWIALGNSLRLRMALRISFVDPEKARAEGEKALAGTLLSSTADNAGIPCASEDQANPLWTISGWNEFRASKTIIDAMVANGTVNTSSVNDPRLIFLFSRTENSFTDPTFPEWQGAPNGMPSNELGTTFAQQHSCVWGYQACDYNSIGDANAAYTQYYALIERRKPIMNYSEVCFLKAEAALRGWANAGSVEENYEAGIRASIEESRSNLFCSAGLYESDPDYNLANDEVYIEGVKIESSDTEEEKLEKIISQKWIALFPDGVEAWAEFRRTGYPKMNPVIVNESTEIPQGEFIKKMRYIEDERNLNPNATSGSLNNGQGDGMNVRVWWDTGRY